MPHSTYLPERMGTAVIEPAGSFEAGSSRGIRWVADLNDALGGLGDRLLVSALSASYPEKRRRCPTMRVKGFRVLGPSNPT
jgi:hypothetical protein